MVNASNMGALSASVLVLNRGYSAIQIVGVRRAIRLLYADEAEVIHNEQGQFSNFDFDTWCELSRFRSESPSDDSHHDWIRAVHFSLMVPRVIRLLLFDRVPRGSVHLTRRAVLARDDHQCQYCGRKLPVAQLSLDHVLPRSRGGQTTWENIVCACLKCNVAKGSRTPTEAGMQLARKPIRPQRSPFIQTKLINPKYESWKIWINASGHHIAIAQR